MVEFSWSTFIASLVGSGVTAWLVVRGLSGFLADRWMARYKSGLDKELEDYKNALQQKRQRIEAELGHRTYVSKTQFETEYNALKDCFAALGRLRLSFNGLRPMTDFLPDNSEDKQKVFQSRMTVVSERYNVFVDTHESLYPFIPEEIHEQFKECSKAARTELTLMRTDFERSMSIKGYLDAETRQDKFSTAYYTAARLIRSRFKDLVITAD
jgi:hypothetical protein